MSNQHIKDIAQKAGGVVALSKALGLSRGAVSQWKKIPAERVVDVERVTGIPRVELRPDLFAPADQRDPTKDIPNVMPAKRATNGHKEAA